MIVISRKKKQIYAEIILLLIRQNTIPYGQKHNAFDRMELCLVIYLQWVATRLLHGYQYLLLGMLGLLPVKK